MNEKKKLNFETVKPTLVLGIICLVVAALLAACNLLTAPTIERVTQEKKTASLSDVLPGGEFEEIAVGDLGLPATVSAVYKDTKSGAYVFLMSTKSKFTSSGQSLDATVAIGADGKIKDLKVTSYAETKNFGDYYLNFKGKDKEGAETADLCAGITFSSTAFRAMMTDALSAYETVSGGNVK